MSMECLKTTYSLEDEEAMTKEPQAGREAKSSPSQEGRAVGLADELDQMADGYGDHPACALLMKEAAQELREMEEAVRLRDNMLVSHAEAASIFSIWWEISCPR